MPEQQPEIRSTEVQELLGQVPNWMVRWGITLIFFLIVLLLFISWLIKYPDVVKGDALITTEIPPVKLVTKGSGKITDFYTKDVEEVKQNDPIIVIENPLSFDATNHLNSIKTQAHEFIELPNKLPDFTNTLTLGSIQATYNELVQICGKYYHYSKNNYGKKKLASLNQQIKQYKRLIAIADSKEKIARQELRNAQEKYNSDHALYQRGVIAKMEFYEQESQFHQKQQNLENLKLSGIQNRITQTQLEQQKVELDQEINNKERAYTEGIKSKLSIIENELIGWEQTYLLSAPISGKLAYLKKISVNQNVTQGEELIAIIPENSKTIGILYLPQQGIGKVKVGQIVNIKLNNYPYQEFGAIKAKITSLSLLPNESKYRAEVKLLDGLTTTFNKHLEFSPEMEGTAEVITEDLRLIDRIFNQLRKVFER